MGAFSPRIAQERKAAFMAKEDTKPAPAAQTNPTATTTKATSEPATPTGPVPEAPSEAAKPAQAPDPMAAWLETRLTEAQYLSPAWQVLTSALEFYRGLKANALARGGPGGPRVSHPMREG